MKKLKMPTWIKKLLFELDFRVTKSIVVSNPSLLTYPIVIFMTFNKELLWNCYKKGYSVRRRVTMEVIAIRRRVLRTPSKEVKSRYHEWLERNLKKQEEEELSQEIDDFIRKNNIKLKNEN